MKPTILLLLGVVFVVASGMLLSPDKQASAENSDQESKKVLRHVVLFKFKADATPEQIDDVVKAFQELPEKIDAIQDFEWGINNSPEEHSKGLTHCFLVTFASEEDRDAYLPHPAHKAFAANLGPILEDVTVVDYWAHE